MVGPPSIAARAVRGAVWMTLASVAMRGLGLVGTLVITHFLSPGAMGEASAAWILVMTGPTLLTPNIGSYLVTHTRGKPGEAFHGLVLHVTANAVALSIAWVLAAPLTARTGVPAAAVLVPYFVLSVFLDSIAFVPERMLERELEFGKLARARTVGEMAYTVMSIALAALGAGALAIAVANVARSAIKACAVARLAPRAQWLEPHPISRQKLWQMARFGLPLTAANVAVFASRRWDNLIISRFYGPTTLGHYNLAYNLAEIPAIQVGEQIGDVLLSSFSMTDARQRKTGLIRAAGLTALVLFPLAAGIGAVSDTVIAMLMPPAWRPVAPMLAVLSCVSIARPIGDTIHAYMLAQGRTRPVLWLAVTQLAVIGIALFTIGKISTILACMAIVASFVVSTTVAMWLVHAAEGALFVPLLKACAGPLLSCVPLAVAVLGARAGLRSMGSVPKGAWLVAEILAGACAYGVAAILLAPSAVRDLKKLATRAFERPR